MLDELDDEMLQGDPKRLWQVNCFLQKQKFQKVQ